LSGTAKKHKTVRRIDFYGSKKGRHSMQPIDPTIVRSGEDEEENVRVVEGGE
jgi:hypothetical protein